MKDLQIIRKGNFKHYVTECFWCKKALIQRYDVFERQDRKYGHSCCKNCFGKEQSFKDAMSNKMKANNPFKGKKHSEATKAILSERRTGTTPWNKGLTAESNESVKKYADKMKSYLMTKDASGDKNPNWKGGSSLFTKDDDFFTKWLPFRNIILDRDYCTCYKCNNVFSKRKLEVHHLISKAKFPEYRYDEFNCVTLCKKCHKEFHRIHGCMSFTPLQWKDWINEGRDDKNRFHFN